LLRAALAAHQSNYVTHELSATLMPHSIIHGDACFASFNKTKSGASPKIPVRFSLSTAYIATIGIGHMVA
jgi:hypothetical protein